MLERRVGILVDEPALFSAEGMLLTAEKGSCKQ
jgi:hypothetical protein